MLGVWISLFRRRRAGVCVGCGLEAESNLRSESELELGAEVEVGVEMNLCGKPAKGERVVVSAAPTKKAKPRFGAGK